MSKPKKILFTILMLTALVAGCELVTRVFFAILAGPSVLAYGIAAPDSEARALAGSAMRALSLHRSPDPANTGRAYRKFAAYEEKTDTDVYGEPFSPAINSRGFRGRDFAGRKEPGVVRIVTLGASSTFGYHDRDDETYPHYTEQLMNTEADGRRFEVLNLGIPHLTTDEIVSLFIHEALPLEPDVVTLYAGNNDAAVGIFSVMNQRNGGGRLGASETFLRSALETIRAHLLLVAFADSVLYYTTAISPHTDEDLRNLEAVNLPNFIDNVSRIRDECERRGILFVVATQQAQSYSRFRFGPDVIDRSRIREFTYEDEARAVRAKMRHAGLSRRELVFLVHSAMMQELRDWSRRNGIYLADVIAALDHDRDVLLSWVHLEPRGNQMVARCFVDTILAALADQSMPVH